MTNAELIQAIRAEIERLKGIGGIVPLDNREQKTGYESALIDIEIFLDTLESEKPMNQEGLVEEVQRYYFANFAYITSDQPTLSILTNIARHFAQWGAEHTPIPEDTVLFNKGVAEGRRLAEEGLSDLLTIAHLQGADQMKEQILKDGNVILTEEDFEAEKEKSMEWGYNLCKEQMMKDAVEGDYDCQYYAPAIFLDRNLEGIKDGDKVRIIVLPKED